MEVKSGKAFADFIIALNEDVHAVLKDGKELTEESVVEILKEARKDMAYSLVKDSDEKGTTFHTAIFGLFLDLGAHYCLFDNQQLARVQNYELLFRRYDMVWSFFRSLVDSFSLLESQKQQANERPEENQPPTE